MNLAVKRVAFVSLVLASGVVACASSPGLPVSSQEFQQGLQKEKDGTFRCLNSQGALIPCADFFSTPGAHCEGLHDGNWSACCLTASDCPVGQWCPQDTDGCGWIWKYYCAPLGGMGSEGTGGSSNGSSSGGSGGASSGGSGGSSRGASSGGGASGSSSGGTPPAPCASDGDACQQDADCCSTVCTAGVCGAPIDDGGGASQGCRDDGYPCQQDVDCCSGACTAGTCGVPGDDAGSSPPACGNPGDACQQDSDCCSGSCDQVWWTCS